MSKPIFVTPLLATALIFGASTLALAAETAAPAPGAVAVAAGDAEITSKVKTALTKDQKLAATPIDVTTTDGVVVLKGKIATAESAEQAIKLASGVPGVKDVRSELKLGS